MSTDPDVTGIDPNHPIEQIIRGSLAQPYIEDRPLAASRLPATLIIDRIFKLLVKMIGVLQEVASTQANRLTFLTNWQRAYSDQMNQIHAFVANNGDGVGGDPSISDPSNTTASQRRDDLNRVNATYTQNLQSRSDLIGNDSKALQSNLNQTSDAVTQQANMATELIQELSTILTAIYR